MKDSEIQMGGEYQAKLRGDLVPVRIVSEKAFGGRNATRLDNSKKVFISLARLLQPLLEVSTTPHATLYATILCELQIKGDASRFVKTDRGHFQLRIA